MRGLIQFTRGRSRPAVFLLAFLLWFSFSLPGTTQCSASAPDYPAVPCAIVAPGSLTESLTCAGKAEAIRRLTGATCLSANTTSVMEVRNVWRDRASLPADAAARDPIVQVFMANCLVAASGGPDGPATADPSAVAFLRNALSDPALAGVAMMGLAPVLTQEDIATIVRMAPTQSMLAMPAIMALSVNCTPEAKSGIASIRAAYVGSPELTDIDHFIAEPKGPCNGKGPLIGKRVDAQVALAPNTALPLSQPTAAQVRAALDAPYAKPSLHVLLTVGCAPGPSDAVDEMRRAWHERNSPDAGATMRDPVAQAVIASCLITAAVPSERVTTDTVEAATLLRTSIRSNDVTAVMAAVTGLASVHANEDVERIADVPRRMPSMLNSVIRCVGFTCGANNLKTLAVIREELTTETLRDQFDAEYKRVEEVRRQQGCEDAK